MRKFAGRAFTALCLCLVLLVPGCRFVRPGELTGGSASAGTGGSDGAAVDLNVGSVDGTGWKIAMITDTGGINDQSFNQSAWEGLQALHDETGAEVNYIESKQSGDFTTNFETLVDNGNSLCWGIGYACADAVVESAQSNPDVAFACVDNAFSDSLPNVTGVVFRAEESSFMVGYIAAAVSKTNKVGFVGGISSEVIEQFEYGYMGGVAYANRVLGKNVVVVSQYAESFSDAAKGKSIANKMFTDGCDIVYHAAGGTGTGVIEAAKEAGKFAIGVDRDQAYLAPNNVLTSSLKNVNVAVNLVSKLHIVGREIGGKTLSFGLTDGAVGIPADHSNYPDEVYDAAIECGEKIKEGIITPPATEEQLEAFREEIANMSVEELTRKAGDYTGIDGTGHKIAMITDTGGINDQSFNQSAWEGLQRLRDETGAEVNYIESKQSGDFTTNFETLIDNGNTLCWGIGYACADAVIEAADANPNVSFACVDNAFGNSSPNVTGVVFRAEESSFMVGYIAAAVSKTDKVGFVGGIRSEVIEQFQYGFEAGVDYANKKLGKNVTVVSQYAESFSDAAKGKSIANKMFTDGCDIVYHAAGGTGTGVIEAAKESGNYAIGVDRDQAYLAPENVLTSSLKNVDIAVDLVSRQHILGRKIGGKNLSFGLTEDAVGIPEHHENYSDEIYNEAIEIGEKIKNGEIDPPATEIELKKFKESTQF